MKLINFQVQKLLNALQSLDGQPQAVTDAEGRSVVIVKPYTLDFSTRMAIAANMTRLKPLVEQISVVHNGLIKQYSVDGKTPDKGTREYAQLTEQVTALLKDQAEVDLIMIRPEKLNVDKNQIAGSVLSDLDPVLTKEDP
jgi:hypothetical protein